MPEPLVALDDETFFSLKHPLQPRRFALALFFSLILFPLIALGLIVGTVFVVVPLIGFSLWMIGRILFARFMGNSILVSELNYPRVHNLGEDLRARIGYKKPVNIFVYEQGNFNAYLMKFFFYRRAVFLNSELLEAGVTDDELRWLIGRFVGYLRARRQAGFWGWTIRAAQPLLIFNFFLLPYERALVYTGDRIALAVINGDISSAIAAMQKLLVGRQLGYSVNPNGLLDQHRKVKGSLFAFLARVGTAFPHTTARYVDLIEFAKERFPEQFQRFDAQNPGLPDDIQPLTALPGATIPLHGKKDPVWASLTGAVVVVGLYAVFAVTVIVPEFRNTQSKEPSLIAPVIAGTTTPSSSAASSPVADAQPAAPDAQAAAPDTAPTALRAERYVSSEGHFSVAFPGSPTHTSKPLKLSDTESATLHQYQFTEGGLIYIVTYNDFPQSLTSGAPLDILASVRDGTLESDKTSLLRDDVIDLNGVPGRAYAYLQKDRSTFVARNFLKGQRLYQIVVIVGENSPPSSADEFLNSFRIH